LEEPRFSAHPDLGDQAPPVQTPRIPIWVAGIWPHKKPFRRAAQFEGVYPQQRGGDLTPEDYREILAFIQSQRTQTTPFEVLTRGRTSGSDPAADAAHVATYSEAGVTWWMEQFRPQHTLDMVRKRIRQGPPHVS
jgi:hypothetical protein